MADPYNYDYVYVGTQGCVDLEELGIVGTAVPSLAPLSGLRRLRLLNARYCTRLAGLDGLEGCCQLQELDLQGTPARNCHQATVLRTRVAVV